MQVRVITPPVGEPITLEEAKAYLKVDTSEDDQIITRIISAVRRSSEKFTGLSFITQTLEAYLDSYNEYELPYGPHQSITSVHNVNSDNSLGDEVTVGNYLVSGFDYLTVDSNYNKFKLSQYRRLYKIRVVYVAGFGGAEAIPDDIKLALLKEVSELYENRENTIVGTIVADLSTTTKYLLTPYKRNVLV